MKAPHTYWSKFTMVLPSIQEFGQQLGQQVKATLVFDSAFQLQPIAVRRASSALNPRRLVYQADTLTICLELQESGDGKATLVGEIAPKDHPLPRRVELWSEQQGSPLARAPINDFGFFQLAGIRPATYTLVLRAVTPPPGPEDSGTPPCAGEIVLGPIAFTVGR